MPYHTRNAYHLRISQHTVLPLYLYLDSRHVSWMSDNTLQLLLADLRPRILDKLKEQSTTVDTHRGPHYQFCYFFRKADPHSILIKSRLFTAAPPVVPPPSRNKRAGDADPSSRKKRKIASKQVTSEDSTSEGEDKEPSPFLDIDVDREEKPKPILQLKYNGFNISGLCLCVVVEPWPHIRSASTAPNPTNVSSSNAVREQTPLFLPEDDTTLSDQDSQDGGMMAFSQVLNAAGDVHAGVMEDDDEYGMVLFGDAEETSGM